jgi:hypothetical protein
MLAACGYWAWALIGYYFVDWAFAVVFAVAPTDRRFHIPGHVRVFSSSQLVEGSGVGPQPYGKLVAMRADESAVQQLTDNQREDALPASQPKSK